jgi:hypothetical protein
LSFSRRNIQIRILKYGPEKSQIFRGPFYNRVFLTKLKQKFRTKIFIYLILRKPL